MARSQQTRRNRRGFLILVAVVLVGGLILSSHGDLTNPLETTLLQLNLSSQGDGFTMIGGGPPSSVPSGASSESNSAANGVSASEPAAVPASTGGTMTLATLTAELAATGVDVSAVAASMSAEGRSLDNLVNVVNSGRVTVAELATRLKGETAGAGEAQEPSSEGATGRGQSAGLLDVRWDAIGSVAYDLWFILAVTAAVITIRYSIDWLISRFKRAQHTITA